MKGGYTASDVSGTPGLTWDTLYAQPTVVLGISRSRQSLCQDYDVPVSC